MRSRMVREGSLGLFIILGSLIFVSIAVWLRGFNLAQNTYRFQVRFANANGMKEGAGVRYRGFDVGKIIAVKPDANGVNVTIEISSRDLTIPQDVLIEANQAGLIGETSIDIIPRVDLPSSAQTLNPLDKDCQSQVIICHNDQLEGIVGVSFDLLMRSTVRLAELYTDPTFFANLNNTAKNAGIAAGEIAKLSQELTLLSSVVRKEIKTLSASANSVIQTANLAGEKLSVTAETINTTVEKFGNTAVQLTELTRNANALIAENRGSIQDTLSNLNDASKQLQITFKKISPAVDKFNTTLDKLNTLEIEKIAQNLEVLSANAAEASANFKDISQNINDPKNILLLQKTLDAARATFENTQKITADLDELTGDPNFRTNLLNLVNGLSNLVSSTEDLQGQMETAQLLESLQKEVNSAKIKQDNF